MKTNYIILREFRGKDKLLGIFKANNYDEAKEKAIKKYPHLKNKPLWVMSPSCRMLWPALIKEIKNRISKGDINY
jgi:hypothetical protein